MKIPVNVWLRHYRSEGLWAGWWRLSEKDRWNKATDHLGISKFVHKGSVITAIIEDVKSFYRRQLENIDELSTIEVEIEE